MSVYAPNWNALCCWVVRDTCRCLEVGTDILVGHVAAVAIFIVACGQECFCISALLSKVQVATGKCLDRAVPFFTVGLVVHTDAFPTVLLVIQFESGSVGSGYEIRGGVAREASQLAASVLFEEGDILVLELHGLFGTVSRALHRVFPYPKKAVKRDHC